MLLGSIDMQNLHRMPGDALDRMQHDKAGTVGEYVCLRLGDRFEAKRAVALARDRRLVDQFARRVGTAAAIADRKSIRHPRQW